MPHKDRSALGHSIFIGKSSRLTHIFQNFWKHVQENEIFLICWSFTLLTWLMVHSTYFLRCRHISPFLSLSMTCQILPYNWSSPTQNYCFRLFANSGRHPHFGFLHVENILPLTMQLEICLFERSLVVWKTTEIPPSLFLGSGIFWEACSTVQVPFKTSTILAVSQNRE